MKPGSNVSIHEAVASEEHTTVSLSITRICEWKLAKERSFVHDEEGECGETSFRCNKKKSMSRDTIMPDVAWDVLNGDLIMRFNININSIYSCSCSLWFLSETSAMISESNPMEQEKTVICDVSSFFFDWTSRKKQWHRMEPCGLFLGLNVKMGYEIWVQIYPRNCLKLLNTREYQVTKSGWSKKWAL
jgi:hypothetical protein